MTATTKHPMVILLAEDDDGHATLIQRNLHRAGVVNDVVRVVTGQQALDYVFSRGEFASRPTDMNLLLLLDINLPLLDGFEVLRQLKENPKTNQIPVILLTTTDDPRDIARGYALGCSVYITKPLKYESFVEAIRRLGLFLEIIQVPPMSTAAV